MFEGYCEQQTNSFNSYNVCTLFYHDKTVSLASLQDTLYQVLSVAAYSVLLKY